ncbi:alpha-mannosidase [Zhihengliuella salsuginis]|uniref:Alpha-mannosidase n=1 Tax=Zhihengliuella salsuginis TaxID=578222 RepID=A0ABQ3GA83_9MICC|nr:glycoside hydrolase family 38 C-terminal domain-containing protein [Zhihengliuella salsuginis]GHC98763.1 alpha-mannosidase [Zhihengliuella salsuginis]
MHDDVPLTVGRATRVLAERIRPAVHAVSVPLTAACRALDGEPIAPADGLALDFGEYAVGETWGPAWGTTWFRLTGRIPADWAGERVEAVIDLGFDADLTGFQCEGLVYLPDGTPVKSLNPRNQWVVLAEEAEGGERVEFYIEAASNPVLLDRHPFLPTQQGDVRTSSAEPLYTSRRMDLAVFAAEVHELALDLEVLLELQAELPETSPRRMRVLQALDDALDALDLQDVRGTADAARRELEPALASPAESSAHRIKAIGHAHIDSAWLWPVRETIRKVARTASSMTALIGETDDFLYGMSSAQQFAWLKEHRPEVFARVKEAVDAGRFVPLGGMWVESDTVMPSGESLVRQFLYGQRFFEREFGIRCKGVWLPDSFGYSPALPQLMRRAGFEWFFTQKISWNQVNRFPHHTFDWEGIDGSRVFSHFPPMDTYNSRLSGEELARASRQFRESRHATSSIAPVGWGDGGGGATREMTGKAARLRDLEGSARVEWQHPDDFFEGAKAELPSPPVWVGELYLELHRATLTSQHQMKQGNRRTEHLLVAAELWAATAALNTDVEYPYEQLDRLWETVLLHQFHDILPGTSIAWVHREAAASYARVEEDARAIVTGALAALAGSGDDRLVANASAFDAPAAGVRAVPAGGIAAAGTVHDDAAAAGAPVSVAEGAGGLVLDNGVVRVALDAAGHVVSAVEAATGREAVPAGESANVLRLHQDFPNRWDAWDIDRFYRNTVTIIDGVDELTHAATPSGGAAVTIRRSFGESRVTQRLVLEPGSRTLRIEQETDWHETEKFLKAAFPLDIAARETVAETQFGVQRRPTHTNTSWEAAKFETSMHRFVLVSEEDFGVALVNDSIYGFDVLRDVVDGDATTTIGLSLLRAPRFPDPETDQGRQSHVYGLMVGADIASATAEATVLNTPPLEFSGDAARAGALRPVVAVAGGAGTAPVRSAVKLAADRSGDVVVRVYEAEGRRGEAVLQLDPELGFRAAAAVSLLEEPTDDAPELAFDAAAAEVRFRIRPFEVVTVRLSR